MRTIINKFNYEKSDLGAKGSQLRCQLLTSLAIPELQAILIDIIKQGNKELTPEFSEDFYYYPKGLINPREIELDKELIPIDGSSDYCKIINSWWLEKTARTPVWDMVFTAMIDKTPGLILVEAKAHEKEMNENDVLKAKLTSPNRDRIIGAINEINEKYQYNLSTTNEYQMSNRLAWSIKLASIGIPVILIYLGFINTDEMTISRTDSLINDQKQWESVVRKRSKLIAFDDWGKAIPGIGTLNRNNACVYPIIRTIDIQLERGTLGIECKIKM